MRPTRTPKHLAALAIVGAAALSLTACKSGTPAAGLPTPAGAVTAAVPTPSAGAPTALPSLPGKGGVKVPAAGHVVPTAAGKVGEKVNGVAGAVVGKAKGAAGGVVSGACAVRDLKGTLEVPSAKSGLDVGSLPAGVVAAVVKLVNTTTHSCALDGWAGLTPVAVGSPLAGVKQTRIGHAPGTVSVAAGGTAYIAVGFTSGATCPAVDSVNVIIPGQSGVLQVPVTTTTGVDKPLSVCPGLLRTTAVGTDPQQVLKLIG